MCPPMSFSRACLICSGKRGRMLYHLGSRQAHLSPCLILSASHLEGSGSLAPPPFSLFLIGLALHTACANVLVKFATPQKHILKMNISRNVFLGHFQYYIRV
jgi:hypothetical protein